MVGQFGTYEGTTHFKTLIKWNFAKDLSWNKVVVDGKREPINTTTLEDKEFLYLRRGVYLSQTQTDVLYYSLEKLLEYSFYEGPNSKPLVLDFVQFAMSDGKIRSWIEEKMKDAETIPYPTKLKMIRHVLTEMFETKKLDEGGETFVFKKYFDTLSTKVTLIFSLWTLQIA